MVFFIGASVFMLVVMGTSVRHVSSTMFIILCLLSFSVIKDWAEHLYHLKDNIDDFRVNPGNRFIKQYQFCSGSQATEKRDHLLLAIG